MEDKDYDAGTREDQNQYIVSNRHGSNKNYIKDESRDLLKSRGQQAAYTVHTSHAQSEDSSFNYGYDVDNDEESTVDLSAPERLCNPPEKIRASEESWYSVKWFIQKISFVQIIMNFVHFFQTCKCQISS